jgi:cyclic beta-1,2-glucan synthetase
MYPHPGFKGLVATDADDNKLGQQELWGLGISGDWPILLATLQTSDGLPSVRQLLKVHHYWRMKGLVSDLVILNEHRATYLQELNDELLTTVMASSESGLLERPGGVFIRRGDVLKPEDIKLLRSLARIQVDCDGLGLGNFLEVPNVEDSYQPVSPLPALSAIAADEMPDESVATGSSATASANSKRISAEDFQKGATGDAHGLALYNGPGGFNDRDEYEIRLTGDSLPPAPWINVIGNPAAGFIVSEAGSGPTWAENSYFYRLTPWSNDPVRDPSGECIYLRDDDSGDLWTATPEPIREASAYTVRHGAGYSVFEHSHAGLATVFRVGMPESDPTKIQVLSITNNGSTRRRISITSYVEWVLGVDREKSQEHVRTRMSPDGQVMLACNRFDPSFASQVAFSTISEKVVSFTAARREFVGRNGRLSSPAAMRRQRLSGDIGDTIDPCAALRTQISLEPGETREIVVLLGAEKSEQAVLALVSKYGNADAANAALDHAARVGRARLGKINVRTPDAAFDVELNQWALYQALSCRMWARSALYQSSGAFGFRDQLQDVMAFTYTEPALGRDHIVRCAARQFEEGDVQHWWHPQSGRGVRS